ncbi:MAG: dihydrodipicolinate synthase family protein, partial [Alphaproteobacteria bacterium]|nr:dihydrodipicolinate synthase family protein [Alphaproteobacteria bacterium]
MIALPTADCRIEDYRLTGTPLVARAPSRPLTRTAFAAAHVVSDPLRERSPWDTRPAVDWEGTLSFRTSLWDQGLGLAEAMDTAQRGMGVDWPTALELIQRTMVAAKVHPMKPRVACGAGTDHLGLADLTTEDRIAAAYQAQAEAI